MNPAKCQNHEQIRTLENAQKIFVAVFLGLVDAKTNQIVLCSALKKLNKTVKTRKKDEKKVS